MLFSCVEALVLFISHVLNGDENTIKKKKRRNEEKRGIKNVFEWKYVYFYFDLTFSLIIAAKSRSALHVA